MNMLYGNFIDGQWIRSDEDHRTGHENKAITPPSSTLLSKRRTPLPDDGGSDATSILTPLEKYYEY